jgi:hypothetical protein
MAVIPITESLIVGLIILGAFYIYSRFFTLRNNSGLPLPPGPPAEPFFGHFRTVPLVNPEYSYIKWGKEYGMPCVFSLVLYSLFGERIMLTLGYDTVASDVLYFNILGRPVVVLNSVKAAVDLLNKRGSNYQDRPRFVLFEVYAPHHLSVLIPD